MSLDDHRPHWSDYLVTGIPAGRGPQTIEIEIDPDVDSAVVVLLASRLRGLVEALRTRRAETGDDPLAAEHTSDLLYLLDHLHRVRSALGAQEERLILLLREIDPPATWRSMASRLDTSHSALIERHQRIQRAGRYGLTAAALDDDPLRAREPVTDDGPEPDGRVS